MRTPKPSNSRSESLVLEDEERRRRQKEIASYTWQYETATSKPVPTPEGYKFSPTIAFNWFIFHLKNDPPLLQAFMRSKCFPPIMAFIDWAGIRGYLKEKPWQGRGKVRAMGEGEATYAITHRVETPKALWNQAMDWEYDHNDSSLEWIRNYSNYSWGITDFIAWCLEHGYLEEKGEVQ